jgi:WS/DGAT/MGAT family acyltransferase
MNIALIATVDPLSLTDADGQPVLERVRAHVATRLHRAPALRRVLLPTRLWQGPMAWIDARTVDLADHVLLAEQTGPFDDSGFLQWCARRSTLTLNRSRPLWRIDVVPGLPGGRVGLLLVVHHVLADGLRGVAMLTGLFDAVPDPPPQPAPQWRPAPAPTATALVADNLRRLAAGAGRAAWGLPDLPARLRSLRALAAEARTRSPATPLAGAIGSERRLAVIRAPLPALRAAAHARDVTINDLLLAAVTTGLRDLLLERGECMDGLFLRASVPVGARHGDVGGLLVVPLPVGVEDPDRRLRLISEATRQRKQHSDEGLAAMLTLPSIVARLAAVWARRTASSHVNLYVTNVPGPEGPLYLAGARLLDVAPVAPLVAGVPLSVTALSYDGVLDVSLLADPSEIELTTLAAGVRRGFDLHIGSDMAENVEQHAGAPRRRGRL